MRSLHKVSGIFNGTDETSCYLCVGAIPRKVTLTDLTVATNPVRWEWSREMQAEVLSYAGIQDLTGTTYIARTKLTTTGIYPYEGGDLMTAANQTDVTYGGGIYLGWDDANYQADYDYGSSVAGTPINRWNFVTGLTGYWNVAKVASGSKIGVGSMIRIKEDSTGLVKEAYITALTSDGEVSAEVTLSRAIGSGAITFIGGMYSLAPIPRGKVAPAGILVVDAASAVLNTNDHKILFEMDFDQA